ncbi:unnamed protein product, partial [Effrenium voratum]
KAYQVKIELEQLSRELTSLSSNSTENEVTRKSITQFKDELEQAFAEYRDLQKRLQSPSTAPAAGAAAGAGAASAEGPRGDRGAEMQPVSQRQMLERQQQQMRDMEEPLSALEGSVNNLQQVSSMIRSEITLQNRLLDTANQTADRTASRLTRARSMMTRLQSMDRNRWLGCS